MDDDLEALVRSSVQQALVRSPHEIGGALGELGWRDLAESDEALAFTALFEEQGYLAADTDALDVVTATTLGLDFPASVIWPFDSPPSGGPSAVGDELAVDGIALASPTGAGTTMLVPAGDRLHMLDVTSVDEMPLGGLAIGFAWVRVRARGSSAGASGSWPEIERRSRLAIASELVGLARRIIDVATTQVSSRQQFGRPIGTYQAVRHRLAEAYAEMVGARALVAAAGADGSPPAATRAKAVAGIAHDAVAKHAIQVCGAIGLSEEHPLPRLVRRGFMLNELFGSASLVHTQIGRDLLEQRVNQGSGASPSLIPVSRF